MNEYLAVFSSGDMDVHLISFKAFRPPNNDSELYRIIKSEIPEEALKTNGPGILGTDIHLEKLLVLTKNAPVFEWD